MATDAVFQLLILILALAMFLAIQYFPKQGLTTKLRTKNRITIQANRHITQANHFLSRAKTKPQNSQTLAKTALIEAETAISLCPKDPAPLILKALALEILGHKGSALKSLDLALPLPRVKSLTDRERVNALLRRAELKLAVNRRSWRVDSAIEDSKEALRLLGNGGGSCRSEVFCLLGRCFESKGLRDEAKWAFEEALGIQPGTVPALDGLARLGS